MPRSKAQMPLLKPALDVPRPRVVGRRARCDAECARAWTLLRRAAATETRPHAAMSRGAGARRDLVMLRPRPPPEGGRCAGPARHRDTPRAACRDRQIGRASWRERVEN